MTRASAKLATLAALAVSAAGCQDPYANERARPPKSATGTTSDVQRPGPRAGAIPATPQQPRRSARAAAQAFAVTWVNWDWRSSEQQQQQLARLAVGELARQLQASAANARRDASLARDKPGSRGALAATNLRVDGRRAQGLVVTREQTYTAGRADLGGQRYRVYRVALLADHKRWGVSSWQPQP
jgi:hypothetical protein